ncbi:hypothetical protein JAAARDRAFT_60793 [Jaapia argillacea MUCL 33604]|uniref:Nuclear condensin complex subunit 3 C-terminal domain-containing protein n=1 Tax=Jaapia argillacea MUCL 33604 TaxID=933084 RepID=A0A067PVQ4_9AGAM|nr:hypothetical protein JAAARDRAFT_60793 [Jaapia argillacea MUCL 33604]
MPALTKPKAPPTPNASIIPSLPTLLPKIFDQVQSTSANHQKNFIALYKLQLSSSEVVESVKGRKEVKLVGEKAFQDAVLDVVIRVCGCKKGTGVADRVVRFFGGYVKFLNEKGTSLHIYNKPQDDEEDEDEETPSSRLISRLLKFFLKGFEAKDKTVRYRVAQFVAEMVSHLGELDEDIYTSLRTSLLARTHDKEPSVRVQAVIALSKLCATELITPDEDDEVNVLEVLLEVLSGDPSAEVRRATLLSLPLSPTIIPHILARTRDVDPSVRKLVYTVLEAACGGSGVGKGKPKTHPQQVYGPTHPRLLTIAQRELIIRNGLGDRESGVKAAVGKLVGVWARVVGASDEVRGEGGGGGEGNGEEAEGIKRGEGDKDNEKEGGKKSVVQDLLAFIDLFDFTNEESEGEKVAEDALREVLEEDVGAGVEAEFDDEFYTPLTPARAFLLRVFVDHCQILGAKDENERVLSEAKLEKALPVVTALAFRIQGAYNDLVEGMQREEEEILLNGGVKALDDEEERARKEEERLEREFVIGEMLRVAVWLDYGDEIGRRKMFGLVRDMISQESLPDSLVSKCLDVLRKLSPNERDLIRVVVEVVHELRDGGDDDEDNEQREPGDDTETNFGTPITAKTNRPGQNKAKEKDPTDMTPEEKAQKDAMDLRCLSLCIGMLERVNGTFEENSTLEGILGELIIPAVKRKELALREKGLVSLGLCCLIARVRLLFLLLLFPHCPLQSAPEVLKIRVLQVVFDILMVHDRDFLAKDTVAGDRIVEFLLHIWDSEESDKVQALLCVGIAKLMLSGMIADERVLKCLVIAYVSPDTAGNQELRQCLSYFLPVYCYSSPVNQRRMQKVFIPIYRDLVQAYKDMEDEPGVVAPSNIAAMFVDWTDPQKAVEVRGQVADDTIHIDLATDITKALFSDDMTKEDKKVVCQCLSKLHIPEVIDDDKIRTLKLLMHNLTSRRPLHDTTSKNAFNKFETSVSKKFEKQLEGFNEEEYRELESLKEQFDFLDDIIPLDSDDSDVPRKKVTRKRYVEICGRVLSISLTKFACRRSESVVSGATTGAETDSVGTATAGPSRVKGKSKAKCVSISLNICQIFDDRYRRRRVSKSDDDTEEGGSAQAATPPAPSRSVPKRAASAKKPSYRVQQVAEDESEEDEESTPGPASRKGRSSIKPTKTKYKRGEEEAKLDAEIDNLLDSDGPSDSIMDSDSAEEDVVGEMLDD